MFFTTFYTVMRTISVAIPHYNNSEYIMDALLPIVTDNRVSEIIICDDKSNDIDTLKELLHKLACPKIQLFQNDVNLGSYHNKLEVISKCTNEWAILLDSDNIIDKKFIDTLYKIEHWDVSRIYAPMWAYTFPHSNPNGYSPHLKFTEYKNQAIGPREFLQNWSKTTMKCLANDCNYFAPVRQFTNQMKKHYFERNTMDSQDSAIFFTNWLYDGNRVFVVEDLVYKHRIHSNSNYVRSPSRRYERQTFAYILNRMREKI